MATACAFQISLKGIGLTETNLPENVDCNFPTFPNKTEEEMEIEEADLSIY